MMQLPDTKKLEKKSEESPVRMWHLIAVLCWKVCFVLVGSVSQLVIGPNVSNLHYGCAAP